VKPCDIAAIYGGTPVRDYSLKPWPKWPVYDSSDEEALLSVLHSGAWWSVEGTNGALFEAEFAAFQDAQFGVACTNGTAALEIALKAIGVGCGDEVIVPPYTFVATASSVLAVGATPIFVDICGDTLNIDTGLIEAAITSRTQAVIPVHMAGRPADLDALQTIARKHSLALIEDAAQAHGAEWRGTKVGALGDMGTFSFQASKNLNSGEGGILVTNSEKLSDAAWSVANVGRIRSGKWYEHRVLGSNLRLTEFQTALLRSQLKRLPEQTALRSLNANYLRSQLTGVEGVSLMAEDSRITVHANHLFTFRYRSEAFGGVSYKDFVAALNAEGIPCSTGYVPLYKERLFELHAKREGAWCQIGRRIDYPSMYLPQCEAVCEDTVWIHQTSLLGTTSDMNDIATAIVKLRKALSNPNSSVNTAPCSSL
jgi:dTDP-4-amino-4,6-dideoxygalactose transaminase